VADSRSSSPFLESGSDSCCAAYAYAYAQVTPPFSSLFGNQNVTETGWSVSSSFYVIFLASAIPTRSTTLSHIGAPDALLTILMNLSRWIKIVLAYEVAIYKSPVDHDLEKGPLFEYKLNLPLVVSCLKEPNLSTGWIFANVSSRELSAVLRYKERRRSCTSWNGRGRNCALKKIRRWTKLFHILAFSTIDRLRIKAK